MVDKRENNRNQRMMQLVRRAHGLVENPDIEKHRQSQNHIGEILGNTREIHYEELKIGEYGEMEAEWVSVNRAHMKKYVVLYCHGGGYSTGSRKYARTLTSKRASSTFMDVLCFDYRLSPEHPYPAALEDAVAAWDYLMLLGYGAREVIVAGDSAGGNLALALTLSLKAQKRLKLREQKRLLPRGLVLMSPWTDLTSSGESFQTKAEVDPVLNAEYIDRMKLAYTQGRDLENPLVSPLFGDHRDFPPTYIQVGENEVLYSDARRLYMRLLEEHVSVKFEHFKGMWHVFQMSPFKTAYGAMDLIADFIYDICR